MHTALQSALRPLRSSPGFAASVVLTLALGIGAFTAIFTLIDTVLIRPLPYTDAERLVWIGHDAPGINFTGLALSPGLFGIYRERSETLEELGHWSTAEVTLTGGGSPRRATAAIAASGMFRALGAQPLHGRLPTPGDDEPQSPRVAVLSHSLWQAAYGGDAAILDERIEVDGRGYRIIGVMPRGFAFPSPDTALWLDSEARIPSREFGDFGGFNAIGRMRDGASLETVRADLDARIAELLERIDNPTVHRMFVDAQIVARPLALKERVVGAVSRTLWVLFGAVGVVLAIACANVGNLFLLRSSARRREIAVRTALGATRRRLIFLFLAESTLLAGIGGAIGVGLARAGVLLLPRATPLPIPRLDELAVDARAFGLAVLITVAAAGLCAALPLVGGWRRPASGLADGGLATTAGRGVFRLRSSLIVVQVALALVLLAGSGLMARSFANLRAVDPGFDVDEVLRFTLALPASRYGDPLAAEAFHMNLLEHLRGLPGVAAVGAAQALPLEGSGGGTLLYEQGATDDDGSLPPLVNRNRVTVGFFETFGIPLLAGRRLEAADGRDGFGAVLVNEALVELYWPGQNPVGKTIRTDRTTGAEQAVWLTIVGVVGNQRTRLSPGDGQAPMLYMPMLGGDANEALTMSYALRTEVPTASLAATVRSAVWAADPDLPVLGLQSMREVADAQVASVAFTMTLLAIASAVSLALGIVGIHGVFSFIVGERTREIGIRMALGASRRDVWRSVLRQGAATGALGASLGLAGSLATARLLGSLLVDVEPLDPATHLSVATALLVVVLAVAAIPARRAAEVDPASALRR